MTANESKRRKKQHTALIDENDGENEGDDNNGGSGDDIRILLKRLGRKITENLPANVNCRQLNERHSRIYIITVLHAIDSIAS